MNVLKQLKTSILLITCVLCQHVYARQGQPMVSGIVQDVLGQPLIGVSVKAINQSSGKSFQASTSEKGLFQFMQMPLGGPYDFVFSYIGYQSDTLRNYQLSAGKQVTLSVKLQEEATGLGEVVIVGYGTSSKREITGSITSVSSEEFNAGVFSTPGQLLQGKVAGLNITRSGNPNEKPTVILRGPTTLRAGSQEPFYVIDGVPGASIDLVAPDDIESIDVLKDAASTAIYGSRAANGVIMVTTKKAKAGATRLSYSTYVAAEQISNTIDMLSGEDLRAYLGENGKTAAQDDGSNTDWQEEVSRTGISHNHNLSFSGSGQNSSYGASVNYLNNQGVIKGTSMERFIVRGYMEQHAFNDRLKLNLNITNSNTDSKLVPNEVYSNMLTYLPTVAVKQPDGSYTEDFSVTRGYLNPVSLIDNNDIRQKTKVFLASGGARVTILEGFDFTTNVSYQDERIDSNVYYNRFSGLAQNLNGRVIRNTVSNTKKILESFFNYNRSFGEHGVKLLAGYSWQEDRLGDGFQTTNQGFVTDGLSYNNPGLGDSNEIPVDYGTKRIQTLRLISFYGRANYQYKGRYLLQASLRRDGSSAFGENNKWGLFPAVSLGWLIDQEAFMQALPVISSLKLRAGYGVSGNSQGFNVFTSRFLYAGTGRFYYNGRFVNAIGPFQNENPDLKWERTATLNIGLDFGLFNNKLSGSVDVYDKRTSDLLWTYPVSATQYFVPELTANAGEMSNKGIELALQATPVNRNGFSWTTAINLAHNRNKMTSLSNDNFELPLIQTAYLGGRGQSGNASQRVQEGYALGSIYTWRYAGKNAEGVSQFYDKDGNLTTAPTSNDFYYIGNAQPKLIYGWNNTFKYKSFDLNFFLRGVTGNKIINATLADMNAPNNATQTNIPQFTLDEQEPINDNNAYLLSDRFVESGSYLRLDNATLGYNFKKDKSMIRIYVGANNLFVITNYRGIDPEISMGGIEPGIDNRNYYPKTRSFMLGLNVNF
ncbi:SusC/RagA family TonB-linked outer membrane protein [Olivibacter sp. LS-1]|jgi:iron complex outermembrane receptor protein|uniref:SusC/RagA family TonB-linked outer membrane protein n=1 Tax=Olivibacter sp. LS-1 TaxID=2592345 RepID=UPI0011EADF3B|nr:SusC/RagA family TonB-linked outer membrane protein [Olivibacter sp. LS-1]QEL03857.1 SusC/RagA family TonB-linked outer membrane protein [Olivibacter sp. LS-1]